MNEKLLNTPAKLLFAVAQILDDHPEVHCKRHFAIDAKGRECSPSSKRAVRFCALGIMKRLQAEGSTTAVVREIAEYQFRSRFGSISTKNDREDGAFQVSWRARQVAVALATRPEF